MKKLSFNIKDRKTLSLFLGLILVCVFTLSVAYAALNTVLTIQGNAEVVASSWDIYLNNPRVTTGSVTTNVPVIKTSSTLEFETTLNMPGDFYEFVVDVVNDGSIDAIIENVVKTPDLTVEQAKFLKYEVSYQNGESITTKQLLAKDTTMSIKVRIEYRKDLNNGDLPTGQVVLDLSLTLEYIQSDGTGTNVNNNGNVPISANGNINEIGTIVTIGSEQFYTFGTEGDNVKLLSAMNITIDENPIQSLSADTTAFSNSDSTYTGSIIEGYVNDYKIVLESFGIKIEDARLITYDELSDINTFACEDFCSDTYPWIYLTSYWTGSAYNTNNVWVLFDNGWIDFNDPSDFDDFGVRPVIVISKDYFE